MGQNFKKGCQLLVATTVRINLKFSPFDPFPVYTEQVRYLLENTVVKDSFHFIQFKFVQANCGNKSLNLCRGNSVLAKKPDNTLRNTIGLSMAAQPPVEFV